MSRDPVNLVVVLGGFGWVRKKINNEIKKYWFLKWAFCIYVVSTKNLAGAWV